MDMNKLSRRITHIQSIANRIDNRINLFENYMPKRMDLCKNELLFWKQIVSFYGLFADCDQYQLKEKNSLLLLMKDNGLIDSIDFLKVKKFWNNISNFRAWFCHNNDCSLYYSNNIKDNILNYLYFEIGLTSTEMIDIEEIQDNEWNILSKDFENRFEEYMNILEKGLNSWDQSPKKSKMINDWIFIFANALFKNKELINNILAHIAQFEIQNQNLKSKIPQLANQYRQQLDGQYTFVHIENELKGNTNKRTNGDIVLRSIINSRILQNITLR